MPIPVSSGTLLEFVAKGFYNDAQEVVNVYHYKVDTGTSATLDQYAFGILFTVLPTLQAIMTPDVVYTHFDAKILDADGALVNGETVIIPDNRGRGTMTGETMPPFVTWTFKLLRPDASYRHGWKRYAGVSESYQNKGLPTSGAVTLLNAHAVNLYADVTPQIFDYGTDSFTPVSGTMLPVIVQRVINGTNISPVNVGNVAGVSFDKIGTQNSRKYGRGS